jgi:hypothetical protein
VIRRRGRLRRPVVDRDGDLVVDAHVVARLLGLHLLDLDARVVVGTARDESGDTAPAPRGTGAASVPPAAPLRLPDGDDARTAPRPALNRAVRLLGEGSSALDEARVMRQVRVIPGRAVIGRGSTDGARGAGPP